MSIVRKETLHPNNISLLHPIISVLPHLPPGISSASLRRSEKSTTLNNLLISIRKIPANDFRVLRTTNDPSCIELEFEHPGVGLA